MTNTEASLDWIWRILADAERRVSTWPSYGPRLKGQKYMSPQKNGTETS